MVLKSIYGLKMTCFVRSFFWFIIHLLADWSVALTYVNSRKDCLTR